MDPYKDVKKYIDDVGYQIHFTPFTSNSKHELSVLEDDVHLRLALQCLKHSNDLTQGLRQLQRDSTLTDVAFLVDGKTFQAHRCVLTSVSSYFKALFTHGFQESRKKEIEIKDIDCNIFEMLLDCAYSGRIRKLSTDTVMDVYHGAVYLQLAHAQDIAMGFLSTKIKAKKLSPEEVFKVMLFAEEQQGLSKLQEDCFKFLVMNENFAQFIGSEEFIQKGPACLIYRFLGRGDKSPDETNEEQVCK